MDGVLHWIVPAAAQVEQAQLGVHLAEVGHGRHDAVFQNLTAITSSTPTPIGWPVKPLVLAMMILLAASPKVWRRAVTSAERCRRARGIGFM